MALGALSFGTMFVSTAQAGTVILEGSDAVGEHCFNGNAGACTYRDQLWTAIGGSDARPIAVIGDVPGISSGTHAVVDFPNVAAAGDLSQYVAVDFLSGNGCCYENDNLVTAAGAQSAVTSYLTSGGTVVINNYIGGSAWDFAVGTSGGAYYAVAGYGGGAGGEICSDGETVTADGLLNGFVQPPAISCWTHQAYSQAVFGALGFTHSFFDAPSDIGGAGWSSLLSSGYTATVTHAPEPMTLAVLSVAVTGFGVIRRRRCAV